jgi:hypothetical protein
MPNQKLPVDIEIVMSGLILLIGGLYLLANLDIAAVREIANLIWPLSLIATGAYWHPFAQLERERRDPRRREAASETADACKP